MNIQLSWRHDIKITDEMKQFVNSRLAKLEKFYDKITSCHVVLDSESTDKVVEIVINGRQITIKASAKADTMAKALDTAIEKAERQLIKINKKTKDHKTKALS